jgi:hypothetical protein
MTDLTPLKLFSTSPGNFSLILSDDKMVGVADLFVAAGQMGHGYDWESVARTAVRLDAPDLADRFRFDPEAGMFCAYGSDEAALRALGELLCAAFHGRERLAELIEAVEPGDWD